MTAIVFRGAVLHYVGDTARGGLLVKGSALPQQGTLVYLRYVGTPLNGALITDLLVTNNPDDFAWSVPADADVVEVQFLGVGVQCGADCGQCPHPLFRGPPDYGDKLLAMAYRALDEAGVPVPMGSPSGCTGSIDWNRTGEAPVAGERK